MDTSTPEGKIVFVLKQELRARGLYYRDIASRLGVSESTVKRYFTGKDISLAVLRKLADVANLDLGSLVALAEQQDSAERKFTKVQQVALAKNKFLSVVFYMLWHGWTPTQIAREFEIGSELDDALGKMESLGVIRRLAHGVKILATPDMDERGGGFMAEFVVDNASQFLRDVDFRDPRAAWTFYAARLSPASVAHLRDMIKKFVEETRALTIKDTALPREKVQWFRLLVVAQPAPRKQILRKR